MVLFIIVIIKVVLTFKEDKALVCNHSMVLEISGSLVARDN